MEANWIIEAKKEAVKRFPDAQITSVMGQQYRAVIALKLPGLTHEITWRNTQPDNIWIEQSDIENYKRYKEAQCRQHQ